MEPSGEKRQEKTRAAQEQRHLRWSNVKDFNNGDMTEM